MPKPPHEPDPNGPGPSGPVGNQGVPKFIHIEDSSTANTPLAQNGLRVDYVIDGDKKNGALELHISVTATNFAVTDNAWGAVRVALLDSKNVEQWSIRVQADERCPARGGAAPTVRHGDALHVVPAGVSFNRVAVVALNLDNLQNQTLDWGQLIQVGLAIVRTVL